MQLYELIVPAQIGMQSFVPAIKKLHDVMAKHGYRGFLEFPVMQRNWDTPHGQRVQAAVYLFRVTADAAAWAAINAVLMEGWLGKAVYTVNGADVPAAPDLFQAELKV